MGVLEEKKRLCPDTSSNHHGSIMHTEKKKKKDINDISIRRKRYGTVWYGVSDL
jgi:hypothetical protein